MTGKKPCLMWFDSREFREGPCWASHEHDEIDHLMRIPKEDSNIRRVLLDVLGDLLRGQQHNEDAVFVWYIDEFWSVQNLVDNQTDHSIPSTLIGNSLDEMIWAYLIVIVPREDSRVVDLRGHRVVLGWSRIL
jgi:hypothetical protein